MKKLAFVFINLILSTNSFAQQPFDVKFVILAELCDNRYINLDSGEIQVFASDENAETPRKRAKIENGISLIKGLNEGVYKINVLYQGRVLKFADGSPQEYPLATQDVSTQRTLRMVLPNFVLSGKLLSKSNKGTKIEFSSKDKITVRNGICDPVSASALPDGSYELVLNRSIFLENDSLQISIKKDGYIPRDTILSIKNYRKSTSSIANLDLNLSEDISDIIVYYSNKRHPISKARIKYLLQEEFDTYGSNWKTLGYTDNSGKLTDFRTEVPIQRIKEIKITKPLDYKSREIYNVENLLEFQASYRLEKRFPLFRFRYYPSVLFMAGAWYSDKLSNNRHESYLNGIAVDGLQVNSNLLDDANRYRKVADGLFISSLATAVVSFVFSPEGRPIREIFKRN